MRMRADWSRYNPGIAAYIQSFGRFRIPLDIVYGPRMPEGQLLPEVLQTSTLFHALDNARSLQPAKNNSSSGWHDTLIWQLSEALASEGNFVNGWHHRTHASTQIISTAMPFAKT